MQRRSVVSILVAIGALTSCASSSPEHEVPAASATQQPAAAEAKPDASGQAAGPNALPQVEVTITDDAAAEAVFKNEAAKLMACYQVELREIPTITIQWIGTFTTGPSGIVSKVDLVGVHEKLAECISAVVKGTKHAGKGALTRTFIVTMWTGDNKPKL